MFTSLMFMKKIFLASDLSPKIKLVLDRHKIANEHARDYFLKTIASQLEHCVLNDLLIVTKNKKLFKLCHKIRHPVILLSGDDNEGETHKRIGNYMRELSTLKNAA